MPKLRENGRCPFGDKCNYARNFQELRPGEFPTNGENVDSDSSNTSREEAAADRRGRIDTPGSNARREKVSAERKDIDRPLVINRRENKKRKRSRSNKNEEVSVVRNSEKGPSDESEKHSDNSNTSREDSRSTTRRIVIVRRENRKSKKCRSNSSDEVTVVWNNGRGLSDESENHAGSDLNLTPCNIVSCPSESNNNQSKPTEDLLPDLEGVQVVARVKERLARMEEKAISEAWKGDEALKVKIQLVKEKLNRYDFLIKVKRETEKARHETCTVSSESETSSDNISSSGSGGDASVTIILTPYRMRKLVRGWSWQKVKAAVEKRTGASVQRVTGTAPQQICLTGSRGAMLRAKKRIENYIRDA